MNASDFWLEKCVLITGASSGIGRALARHVAARGARVGLLARRRAELELLADEITSNGGAAAAAEADVFDADAVRAAVAVVEQALGPCDVAVANAGILRTCPGYNFNIDNANAMVATNVQGVINTVGAVLPDMVRRREGHICAVASIAALLGLPTAGVYSASKAAVVTLMESLRIDLRRFGIKVTTICPGFIDTPLIANQDRRTLHFLLSAEEGARRIARALERGRAEAWFPWQTWFLARAARAMPQWVYTRIMSRLASAKGERNGE